MRRRREQAFVQAVRRYHGRLLRLAMIWARTRAVREGDRAPHARLLACEVLDVVALEELVARLEGWR